MSRLALIDADILVYEAAYRSQTTVEWEPGEKTRFGDITEAAADFKISVDSIVLAVGGKGILPILALTDSDRAANFRRSVWPQYKCHRETPPGDASDDRPLLYKALRSWVREHYDVVQVPGIEGDDTIGLLATTQRGWMMTPLEDRVICSVDKDLNNVPGFHFNWRKSERGIYYVNEVEADCNFLIQTMTGDSTDGFPGIRGVGPKRAAKILDAASERALFFDGPPQKFWWAAVVEAFEAKGHDYDYMMTQARCARILRSSDWDSENRCPILWTPPKEWL